jgi:hypothetical protein
VLSRAGGFNEQIRFGDNVLTRIDAARTPEAIAAMQQAVVGETLAPLLLQACAVPGAIPRASPVEPSPATPPCCTCSRARIRRRSASRRSPRVF